MDNEIIEFNIPDFSMKISRLIMEQKHSYRDLHSHNAVEIVRVEKGNCDVIVENEKCSLNSGNILLINRNITHKIIPDNATLTYMQIDISGIIYKFFHNKTDYIWEFILGDTLKSHIVLPSNSELDFIYQNIKKEYESRKEFYELYIHSYLFLLVAFLHRNGFIVNKNDASNIKIEKILSVVEYINKNFTAPLTLEKICQESFCDKFHLCHLFKKISGGTVFEYINFVRIKSSIDLLIHSNKSISQIAHICGFSSVNYFNRIFKIQTGTTPSAIRNQYNM